MAIEDMQENVVSSVGKFDKTDLKNLIYKEVIQILEPIEWKGKYKGNAHHLTQEIVEKISSVIWEKNILKDKK